MPAGVPEPKMHRWNRQRGQCAHREQKSDAFPHEYRYINSPGLERFAFRRCKTVADYCSAVRSGLRLPGSPSGHCRNNLFAGWGARARSEGRTRILASGWCEKQWGKVWPVFLFVHTGILPSRGTCSSSVRSVREKAKWPCRICRCRAEQKPDIWISDFQKWWCRCCKWKFLCVRHQNRCFWKRNTLHQFLLPEGIYPLRV